MALADRLAHPPKPMHGTPCSVGALLETLEGDERAALEAMLGTPGRRSPWSAAEVYKALTDEGYEVGYQTIGRHRGGKCRCSK